MERPPRWERSTRPASKAFLSEKTTQGWGRPSKRSRSKWWAIVGGALFLLTIGRYWRSSQGHTDKRIVGQDVKNRTLGFQRVFVITSPTRSDRHDRFALAAAHTDFDFEFSHAVNESSMLPKAAPVTWNSTDHAAGELGKWRAHMDVLQRIVQNGIQTALIFEDDADFDVTFKQQLSSFARGTTALTGNKPGSISVSPYGTHWDLLRIGTCSIGTSASSIYVIESDPTVPPPRKRQGLLMDTNLPSEALLPNSRIAFKSTGSGDCLTAYGVTFKAAQKILAALSMRPHNYGVGAAYGKLCNGELYMPVECYGVYPTLVGVHQSSGPGVNETTSDIVYSMKQNLPQLAVGNTTMLAQWPGDVEVPSRQLRKPLVTGKQYLKVLDASALQQKSVPGVNVAWQ